jgi:hypothetical protein
MRDRVRGARIGVVKRPFTSKNSNDHRCAEQLRRRVDHDKEALSNAPRSLPENAADLVTQQGSVQPLAASGSLTSHGCTDERKSKRESKELIARLFGSAFFLLPLPLPETADCS